MYLILVFVDLDVCQSIPELSAAQWARGVPHVDPTHYAVEVVIVPTWAIAVDSRLVADLTHWGLLGLTHIAVLLADLPVTRSSPVTRRFVALRL